jgi:hypothetical protein
MAVNLLLHSMDYVRKAELLRFFKIAYKITLAEMISIWMNILFIILDDV